MSVTSSSTLSHGGEKKKLYHLFYFNPLFSFKGREKLSKSYNPKILSSLNVKNPKILKSFENEGLIKFENKITLAKNVLH